MEARPAATAQARAACEAIGLAPAGAAVPLAGGRLHTVLRLPLRNGAAVVVKLVSPEVCPPDAYDGLRRAEAVARAAAEQGVRAVAALSRDGDPLVVLDDGTAALVFPFVEGRTVADGRASEDQARTAGSILGRLHAMAIDPGPGVGDASPVWKPIEPARWREIARAVPLAGANRGLAGRLPLLCRWSERYARLVDQRCAPVVASHADLGPGNILWGADGPRVIDWELAGPVDSAFEAGVGLVEWSRDVAGRARRECVEAFLDGYRDECQEAWAQPDIFVACGGRMMAWLAYNGWRAAEEGSPVHARRAADTARLLERLEEDLPRLAAWVAEARFRDARPRQ